MKTVLKLVSEALYSKSIPSHELQTQADALDAELARLRDLEKAVKFIMDECERRVHGARNDALEEAAEEASWYLTGSRGKPTPVANRIRARKTPAPVAGDGGADGNLWAADICQPTGAGGAHRVVISGASDV